MLLTVDSSSASSVAAPAASTHRLVGDEEADPRAREAGLGERPEVDHPLVGCRATSATAGARRRGRTGRTGRPPGSAGPRRRRRRAAPRRVGTGRQRAGRVGEVGHQVQRPRVAARRRAPRRATSATRRGSQAVGGLRHRHHVDVEQPGRAGDARRSTASAASSTSSGPAHRPRSAMTIASWQPAVTAIASAGTWMSSSRGEHAGDEAVDLAVGAAVLHQQRRAPASGWCPLAPGASR